MHNITAIKINRDTVAIDLIGKGWKVYQSYDASHPVDIIAQSATGWTYIKVVSRITAEHRAAQTSGEPYDRVAIPHIDGVRYDPPLPTIKEQPEEAPPPIKPQHPL